MTKISKEQRLRYFALLQVYYSHFLVPKSEQESVRKEIIQGGQSLTTMSYKELAKICNEIDISPQVRTSNANDLMRKKIIGLLAQSGMKLNDKPDMNAIYAYILKVGYLKKGLNDYIFEELQLLVSQIHRIVAYKMQTQLKKAQK